ncbi:peptidylprolyl isomerase [Sarracenia purpurea var. burkii]
MKMPSDKTRAPRILIKHDGSRRKASWKDLEGRVILTPLEKPSFLNSKLFAKTLPRARPSSRMSPLVTLTAAPPNVAAISGEGRPSCSPSVDIVVCTQQSPQCR